MDPIIVVPIALAVAWATTRKKKKPSKKTEPLPAVTDEPPKELPPPPQTDPIGPYDGPGGQEPWRPGGPQVGPKTFPGPSEGPKPPEEQDPSPVEIYPGTTAEEIEGHANSGYAIFISSDCEMVYEGERWYSDVFLPKARELVLDHPALFHHPAAIMYELLVAAPTGEGFFGPTMVTHRDHQPTTGAGQCLAAWADFVYGDFTPEGTYSGWISERSDPRDEYWDYLEWFDSEYPDLSMFLGNVVSALWREPELAEVFERDWPADEPPGELDFE